jgi:DNA invertase Pin-like site-specific DNA recombinase
VLTWCIALIWYGLSETNAAELGMISPVDVLVVRWVDRPGRNYEDVCDTIREFMRRGVVIRTR